MKNRKLQFGIAIFAIFVLLAVLAPWIVFRGPLEQPDIVQLKLQPPSSEFFFGSDHLSRDIFSRIAYGARISLSIGCLSAVISVFLGTLFGAIAGFWGGWVDTVLMRFTDCLIAFPGVVLLMAIVGLFPSEHSIFALIFILGFTGWMPTARLLRDEVRALKEREFVLAGKSLGISPMRIIAFHILPNCVGPIAVSANMAVAGAILSETALSYLGIGLPAPMPSWGNMVSEGAGYITTAPWMAIFPIAAIFCTIYAIHLMGESLQERSTQVV